MRTLYLLCMLVFGTVAENNAIVINNRKNEPISPPDVSADDDGDAQSLTAPSKNGSPLKCCVLCEPSPLSYVSGYATRFQEMLRFLHRNGDLKSHLITTEVVSSHRPTEFAETGFPVYYTRGIRFPFYKSISISMDWTFCIWRVIHKQRPDILHVTSPSLLVFSAIVYSRIYSIPLVMSYHTHLPKYVHSYLSIGKDLAERMVWSLLRLHRFSDLTLVTSEQIQQEFLSRNIVRHCNVWQKGIDTNKFHPLHYSESMREKMTNGFTKDFVMLYVGRLAREKRIGDLQAVLSDLQKKHPDCRLCIVGTGPQHAELEAEIFGKDDPSVVFMGELHGVELAQAFASADVFVFPSDSETLGFVVLEAMASGLPVVAAAAGGVPGLIDDNKSGFLCTPGNTREYVHRLSLLQQDPILRDRMGKRARAETEQWSWDASMHNLRHVQYLQAIKNFEKRTGKNHISMRER